MNQPTAHSTAACPPSRKSHQCHSCVEALLLKHGAPGTPLHSVKREVTTLHLNSGSNYYFFLLKLVAQNYHVQPTNSKYSKNASSGGKMEST